MIQISGCPTWESFSESDAKADSFPHGCRDVVRGGRCVCVDRCSQTFRGFDQEAQERREQEEAGEVERRGGESFRTGRHDVRLHVQRG